MFIEYTITSSDSLIILAVSNINDTIGSSFEMASGEFTAQYSSNRIALQTTALPSLFPSSHPSSEPTVEPTIGSPSLYPTNSPTNSLSLSFLDDAVPNVTFAG